MEKTHIQWIITNNTIKWFEKWKTKKWKVKKNKIRKQGLYKEVMVKTKTPSHTVQILNTESKMRSHLWHFKISHNCCHKRDWLFCNCRYCCTCDLCQHIKRTRVAAPPRQCSAHVPWPIPYPWHYLPYWSTGRSLMAAGRSWTLAIISEMILVMKTTLILPVKAHNCHFRGHRQCICWCLPQW